MKDYDTSWVPKGHVLTVSKRKFYLSRFFDEDVEKVLRSLGLANGTGPIQFEV